MIHAQRTFVLSEGRAYRAIGQPRSMQRYAERRSASDQALCHRMSELSGKNPRYGYRRVWTLLRQDGWVVNKKRIRRLRREAGLKVPALRGFEENKDVRTYGYENEAKMAICEKTRLPRGEVFPRVGWSFDTNHPPLGSSGVMPRFPLRPSKGTNAQERFS